MTSTLRTGALPRHLAIALDALQGIAEQATIACRACREVKAELTSTARFDDRVEREHVPLCAGEIAWHAIVQIAVKTDGAADPTSSRRP